MMQRTFVITGDAPRTPTLGTKAFVPIDPPPFGLLYRPTIEIKANVGAKDESDLQRVSDCLKEYFEGDGWTNVSVTAKR